MVRGGEGVVGLHLEKKKSRPEGRLLIEPVGGKKLPAGNWDHRGVQGKFSTFTRGGIHAF